MATAGPGLPAQPGFCCAWSFGPWPGKEGSHRSPETWLAPLRSEGKPGAGSELGAAHPRPVTQSRIATVTSGPRVGRRPWLTRQLCFLDVARGHECSQASAGARHRLALRAPGAVVYSAAQRCVQRWLHRSSSALSREKDIHHPGFCGNQLPAANPSALQECPELAPELTGPLLLLRQERGVGFTAQHLPRPRREQYQCSQAWERSVPCHSTASCTCRVQKSLFPERPGTSAASQAALGTAWPSGPGRKCHGPGAGKSGPGRALPALLHMHKAATWPEGAHWPGTEEALARKARPLCPPARPHGWDGARLPP